MTPSACVMIRRCAGLLAARRLRAVRLHRARWAASRRNRSRHPRTSLLLPICPASGSTLCTVAARREASCSTWIHFAAADPDNDGTLDKNEFLALVEKRFKAADPDNEGTVDAKELKSAAGRSLTRLLN